MTFSAQIRQAVEPIWAASMEHPFVKGIGDGTLPLENFRFYIQQDSYYLTRFAKILALGAAKAPDIATTNQFADFAKHTYSAEIGLHEQFSKRLGITAEEKELFKPAPTTYAYTSISIAPATQVILATSSPPYCLATGSTPKSGMPSLMQHRKNRSIRNGSLPMAARIFRTGWMNRLRIWIRLPQP